MREVKVVDAAHDGVDLLAVQRRGQSRDERGLADALDAIEANYERLARLVGCCSSSSSSSLLCAVRGQVLKDKGHAYGRLVVYKSEGHRG